MWPSGVWNTRPLPNVPAVAIGSSCPLPPFLSSLFAPLFLPANFAAPLLLDEECAAAAAGGAPTATEPVPRTNASSIVTTSCLRFCRNVGMRALIFGSTGKVPVACGS